MNWFLDVLDHPRHAVAEVTAEDAGQFDIFVARQAKMRGVVLGDIVVMLDERYHCTYRLDLRNLEYLRDYEMRRLRERPDKEYVGSYLAANADSPYGVQNILNCAEVGYPIRDLTQFPPLYSRKTAAQQRAGIDRIRATGKAGDLVLSSHRRSGLSRRIRALDRSPFSHMAMIYETGTLAEITTSGKLISRFEELEDPAYDVALYRLKGYSMTPEEEAERQRYWRQKMNYGWHRALQTWLIKKLHLPQAVPHTAADILYLNILELIDWV